MKKAGFLILSFLIFFAFLSCGGSKKSSTSNNIVIGAIFSLSGEDAFIGSEARDGALLAFQRINARGGLLGKRLDFISEDDEGSDAKAVQIFNKLITENGAHFIIGSSAVGTTRALSQEAQQNQILFISPVVSDAGITKAGDFVFRVCLVDSRQGIVGADFAHETLSAGRAAVLYNTLSEYSSGLALGFKNEFSELGGEIVADETYQAGETDFSAQIARISAARPDVIYLPNFNKDVAIQAKQLREKGISAALLGGDSWNGLTDIAGDELLNSYWTVSFSNDTQDARGREFIKSFNNRYVRLPSYYAALGYDAMYLLAEAINAAGSFDGPAVKDAMTKINTLFETGNIRFDADRNPVKGATVVEIIKQDNGSLFNSYSTFVNPN